MKTTDEIEKFIQLRARGYSFDKIAEETGISKPTLIKYQAKYHEQIEEAQFYEFQNIASEYNIMRKHRFEAISFLYGKALEELKKRADSKNLSRIPTDKLFKLVVSLENKLKEYETGTKLYTPGNTKTDIELRELMNYEVELF